MRFLLLVCVGGPVLRWRRCCRFPGWISFFCCFEPKVLSQQTVLSCARRWLCGFLNTSCATERFGCCSKARHTKRGVGRCVRVHLSSPLFFFLAWPSWRLFFFVRLTPAAGVQLLGRPTPLPLTRNRAPSRRNSRIAIFARSFGCFCVPKHVFCRKAFCKIFFPPRFACWQWPQKSKIKNGRVLPSFYLLNQSPRGGILSSSEFCSKPYCGARIPQPVNKHLHGGRRINIFIWQSSCCQLHISVPASDKVTSPIKMNTHASAFLLGRFPPQCCGCLLPCAKVPAPGRRFDIVPDVLPQVLKTRHSLGPPNLSACLLLDSVTLPILAKMGSERGNSRHKKKHQVQKLKSRNHFVPIPAAFAGAPVGIRWLCGSKIMFETLSTNNYATVASSMAAKMIRTWKRKCLDFRA